MLNLKKVYDLNIDYILGSSEDYFKNLRKDLISNFKIDKHSLKNNESIKFIDPSILKNFNFKVHNNSPNYNFINSDDLHSSITIKNGNDCTFTNIDKKNVSIESINSNLDLLIHKIKKNRIQLKDDYIVNLNSIFLNSGFFLNLKDKTELKTILTHENNLKDHTLYTKNFFHINKNSKLILIEFFLNQTSSNSNIMNFFELESNSEVLHLVIQNNNINSNLQFTTESICNENAKFNQLIFNCSEASVRNHHYALLEGENSDANLKGIFFASKKQFVDNKTEVKHLNYNCTSNQTYKGVLKDYAKASYLSKTFVDRIAQKTDGYQLSKGILLSDDAYFLSKPELKIYADDVKCSHGSTIGPFDNDVIFYLRSRGLNEKQAKFLLINSFCKDLLISIEEELYLKEVNTLINDWLLRNVE